MLGFLVPPEVHLALECLVAELALERFVAGVLPRVGYQIRALAEGFTTYLAFVGLFTWKEGEKRRETFVSM